MWINTKITWIITYGCASSSLLLLSQMLEIGEMDWFVGCEEFKGFVDWKPFSLPPWKQERKLVKRLGQHAVGLCPRTDILGIVPFRKLFRDNKYVNCRTMSPFIVLEFERRSCSFNKTGSWKIRLECYPADLEYSKTTINLAHYACFLDYFSDGSHWRGLFWFYATLIKSQNDSS